MEEQEHAQVQRALLSERVSLILSLGVLRPLSHALGTAGPERRVRPLPCPWGQTGSLGPQWGCAGQWVPEQGTELRGGRLPRRGRTLLAEENIPGRQHCKEAEFLVYLETVQLFTTTTANI